MFDIGAPELLVLVVAAVILFGPEKLPELARKATKVLRYVRSMAGNAQEQLSKELGPEFKDLDFRDLNPKAFVQKHLLGDIEPIVADVKADFADATKGGKGAAREITDALNSAKQIDAGGPSPVNGSAKNKIGGEDLPIKILTPFDVEAT